MGAIEGQQRVAAAVAAAADAVGLGTAARWRPPHPAHLHHCIAVGARSALLGLALGPGGRHRRGEASKGLRRWPDDAQDAPSSGMEARPRIHAPLSKVSIYVH